MLPNDFNFAQPLWLLLLLIIPIAWAWYKYSSVIFKKQTGYLEKFIDPELLPHLLVSDPNNAKNKTRINYKWLAYIILVVSAALALANPRWGYTEIDAYAPAASTVILIDLYSTMNTDDVAPSRIVRARQAIVDLLNLSKGLKIGLVGFAEIPHLISPITDDIKTLKGFLPAVHTDLVTKQGCNLSLALKMAEDLLNNEPGNVKSIVIVSDGNFLDNNYMSIVKDISANNIKINVIGVGTTAGGMYQDNGKIVSSKLDKQVLQSIAKQGNGIYIETNFSDRGLQTLVNKLQKTNSADNVVNGKIRQWEDRYYLFLLPVALMFLYLFYQRAFYVIFFVVGFNCLNIPQANASEVANIFKNSEQQGVEQFSRGNFAAAAEKFTNNYNKGVALYRAGNYAAAEKEFAEVKNAKLKTAAMYNAGNSQMQQKKWQAAIDNYEQVLLQEPDNSDAKFNLELAKKMLEKQDQQDKQDKNNKKDNKNKNKEDNKEDNQDKQDDNQEQKQDQDKNDQKQEQKQDQTEQPDSKEKSKQNAKAELWLNRVDSDIKVFLKNKFYVEDMLNSK